MKIDQSVTLPLGIHAIEQKRLSTPDCASSEINHLQVESVPQGLTKIYHSDISCLRGNKSMFEQCRCHTMHPYFILSIKRDSQWERLFQFQFFYSVLGHSNHNLEDEENTSCLQITKSSFPKFCVLFFKKNNSSFALRIFKQEKKTANVNISIFLSQYFLKTFFTCFFLPF